MRGELKVMHDLNKPSQGQTQGRHEVCSTSHRPFNAEGYSARSPFRARSIVLTFYDPHDISVQSVLFRMSEGHGLSTVVSSSAEARLIFCDGVEELI
jgi:hypothetical protein